MHGVLVVAKPAGPTSHDVVALVRRLAATRRIGHGGTLDPFASGVLPLFLGGATRLVEYHLGDDKAYRATICFGATSTTDDLDGELTPVDGPAPDRGGRRGGAWRRSVGTQQPAAAGLLGGPGRRPARLRDGPRGRGAGAAAARGGRSTGSTSSTGTSRDPDRPIASSTSTARPGTYVRALARDLGARSAAAPTSARWSGPRAGRSRSTARVRSTTIRAAAAGRPGRRSARCSCRRHRARGDARGRADRRRDRRRGRGRFVRPVGRPARRRTASPVAARRRRRADRRRSAGATGRRLAPTRSWRPRRRRAAASAARPSRADGPRMAVVDGIDALDAGLGRLFVVVGVFDGLHRGHALPARRSWPRQPRARDAPPGGDHLRSPPRRGPDRARRRRSCATPTSASSGSRRPASR